VVILKLEIRSGVTISLADVEPTEWQFTLEKTDSKTGDNRSKS
jgi:hypothetical protein